MFNLNRNLQVGRMRDGRLIVCMCVATWLSFFAYIARLSDVTHDAFHEMALIRVFLETGVFPLNDVFAFTPTVTPTVHHEWGTGLILYWITGSSPFGFHGMAILRSLLVLAIGFILYRVARNNGAHPVIVCVCAPILFPLFWVGFATLRAQLFTLLFLSLLMLMLQTDWRGRRYWVLPWAVLYIVWLNVHAGFVVGIAMLGCHMVERWIHGIAIERQSILGLFSRYWHHLLIVPVLIAGVLLNPWGADYAPYLIRAILMPRPTMLEWQPLWMTHDSTTAMCAYAASLLALGYVAKNRRWNRLRGWVFCCIAAYMALKHIRHGSIYALVWIALVPGWLTPTAFGRSAIAAISNFRNLTIRVSLAIAIGSFAFLGFYPPWKATLPSQDAHAAMVYPVGAVHYLREQHFSGNLMTPFASGAFVSWMCYPKIRVSIDGRYEVAFREDVLPKHNRFYAGESDWQAILNEFKADAVLVQKSSPVCALMECSATSSWTKVYDDQVFCVLIKNEFGIPVRQLADGKPDAVRVD